MLQFSPLCVAAIALLQLPAAVAQTAPVTEAELAARIDAMAMPYYKASGPGATLIVVKDGKTILRKAYGLADVAKGVAMQPETVMRLGSITKQFTSTAILMLAEEGKLSLSDPITKFLPDYPTRGKTITIEHLLTHTSGIANYNAKRAWRSQAAEVIGVGPMIESFKNDPADFDPGTQYAYTNSGYFLLGAIIEKISGLTYPQFLQQRIFAPLGMTHTGYEGVHTVPGMRAVGYTPSMWGGYSTAAAISMSQAYAAGALMSNIDDMAKWDAAITSGKLLQPAMWRQAITPYTLSTGKPTSYGYGWETSKVRDAQQIGHGGDIHGFSAYALRLPEQKVYVALLSNADTGLVRPSVVAKKAAAIAIGNPYPELRPVAIDAATLVSYAGDYKLNEQITRSVRPAKDYLQLVRAGRPTQDIYPLGADRFFLKDSLTQYRFERNAAGSVERMVFDDAGIEHIHTKGR